MYMPAKKRSDWGTDNDRIMFAVTHRFDYRLQ